MISRLRAVIRGGDRGYTLAELLVGMVVTSLILAAAATMFDASLRTNQRTMSRTDTVNAARISVESMSRSLRTAVMPSQLNDTNSTEVAFLIGETAKASFYANINNSNNLIGPSRVTYQVTAGTLTQIIQVPDAHAVSDHNYQYCATSLASCTTAATQVLATGVSTTLPLFTYYDSLGNPLSLSSTCPDRRPCLSGANLSSVDSMDVRVAVNSPSGMSIGPSTYLLRVSLPNHDSIPKGASGS